MSFVNQLLYCHNCGKPFKGEPRHELSCSAKCDHELRLKDAHYILGKEYNIKLEQIKVLGMVELLRLATVDYSEDWQYFIQGQRLRKLVAEHIKVENHTELVLRQVSLALGT